MLPSPGGSRTRSGGDRVGIRVLKEGAARPKRWADDRTLIRACLDGDANAWEELVLRYRRLIYSIPIGYRMTAEQADDVFQHVALKLVENLSRLRNAEGLASWLVVTTRRECHAARHGQARYREISDEDLEALEDATPDMSQTLHEIECEHALALALERLGEPCKTLLSALYVEEPTPSYEEIGKRLGKPVGSLGPTRSRCLVKLQKLYLDVGGPDPGTGESRRLVSRTGGRAPLDRG
jgi:RNA polymerase sigma factor (sigma-70 family)